ERLAARRRDALALQAARGPQAALPLFDALVAEAPAHAGLRADRGVCRVLAGLKKEGEADLREALRLDPGHEDAARSLQALR
ncbi:MAG: hypothetical protein SF051_06470, partial [Elusimicrobiota bacterium]|nr:hypothetical protein [Elusimicrobiota bacterium]